MDLISTLHRGVDGLARTSYFRHREFNRARDAFITNRDDNLFFGIHDTWDAANDEATHYGNVGYNNEASAAIYDHRTRIDAHDYPALYWLVRSLQDGLSLISDVGGGIGIKFLAFRDVVASWPNLRWKVCDVPAAVAHGRELSAVRGDSDRLQFTDTIDELQDGEVLFASGVLQYLPQTLGQRLSEWRRLPRRIIINTAAIHPTKAFFTVNSIGTAFCPYRVQTQANLVRELSKLGYKVRETWINPDKRMTIPFHPENSLDHYSGLCLDLKVPGSRPNDE